MTMRKTTDIQSSEITPQELFLERRRFIRLAAGLSAAAFLPKQALAGDKLPGIKTGSYTVSDKPTPFEDITHYNNFYEFGTDKESPAQNAVSLKTRPWTVTVEGEVRKPKVWDIDELLKLAPLEERVYRLRCVEAWSMIIPWVGFPLGELIKRAKPTSNAKFVEFITLNDSAQMPGVRSSVLDWPYREGLRMDEAMHPLTLLAVGLYGEVLPNQNGAPIRVVVPWKYGFKSAKSIVRIRLGPFRQIGWAGLARRAGGEPHRENHPHHRLMDADFPDDHPGDHALAHSFRLGLADSISAHAGPVRLFLRQPAFYDLSGGGPILRLAVHRQGHRQAALHHRRVSGLPAVDSIGGHVHQQDGPAAGCRTLEATAPLHLSHRRRRCGAFLVAGEKRHHRTSPIRGGAGSAAGLSGRAGGAEGFSWHQSNQHLNASNVCRDPLETEVIKAGNICLQISAPRRS